MKKESSNNRIVSKTKRQLGGQAGLERHGENTNYPAQLHFLLGEPQTGRVTAAGLSSRSAPCRSSSPCPKRSQFWGENLTAMDPWRETH